MSANSCINCEHFSELDIGHCYMFREEPDDRCMQFMLVAPQRNIPEEKQTRTKIPAGTTSAINAATGEKIALDAKTVPIKQSTISEIVECLKNAKSATNELIDDEVIPASGVNPVVDVL